MFDVDFRKLFYNMLPHFLRAPKALAWLDSLSRPLRTLNGVFSSFRNNTNYKLQFTSQVIYLEHYLNDQFDPVQRRIFITNINDIGLRFIYTLPEAEPRQPIYLKSEGETPIYMVTAQEVLDTDNFIINVPISLVFNTNVFRAKVDFYNQAGKIYLIETF